MQPADLRIGGLHAFERSPASAGPRAASFPPWSVVETNWGENLVDGHRTLPVLLADLAAAQDTIHLSIFLFFNDPIGQELARVLCERAQAGVRVRVLVNVEKTRMGDPFSTGEEQMMEEDPTFHEDATDFESIAKRLKNAGVEVHDSNLDYDREIATSDPALREQERCIRETSRLDAMHVDHRKLVTIDGRIAYCGSANVGAQYLFHRPFDPGVEAHVEAKRARKRHQPEPWWKWHDGLVRFEGPIARAIDACFRERWVLDGGDDYGEVRVLPGRQAPRGVRLDRVDLYKNHPDSKPNAVRRLFLASIRAARESIFIENPYLYHPEIVRALVKACRAQPSLRVDLVVPGREWNDNEYSQDAMQYHYRRLLAAGVRVWEYQHHFSHLKLATFDSRVSIVGSANLNFRSLENDMDFELVARVESAEFARRIETEVRDVDIVHAKRMLRRRLRLHHRFRDPRTLVLVSRRVL